MSDFQVSVTLEPEHGEFILSRVVKIAEEVGAAIRNGVTDEEKARLESLEQHAHAIYLLLNQRHQAALDARLR